MDLRLKRKLGPQLIQAELLRLHNCRLSTSTIWKVLHRNHAKLLQRRRDTKPKRYSRKVPGESVQLDTRKIAPGIYQYTAVEDCTRLRLLGIYPRRTARNSVHFLEERLLHEFPFQSNEFRPIAEESSSALRSKMRYAAIASSFGLIDRAHRT